MKGGRRGPPEIGPWQISPAYGPSDDPGVSGEAPFHTR
jgi:hypothetical protein